MNDQRIGGVGGVQIRQAVINIVCQAAIALWRSIRQQVCGIEHPGPMNRWAVRDELHNSLMIGISPRAFAIVFSGGGWVEESLIGVMWIKSDNQPCQIWRNWQKTDHITSYLIPLIILQRLPLWNTHDRDKIFKLVNLNCISFTVVDKNNLIPIPITYKV